MKLVIGLGNPEKRYEGTRHNIGFDVLRELADRNNAGPAKAKFESLIADCSAGETKVLLMLPQTYMNRSGIAVQQAVAFYKTPLEDLLVVCDDFNLPLGTLRHRVGGSSGGVRTGSRIYFSGWEARRFLGCG